MPACHFIRLRLAPPITSPHRPLGLIAQASCFAGVYGSRRRPLELVPNLERDVSGSDSVDDRDPKGVLSVLVQIGAGTRTGGWTTRPRAIDAKGTPDVGSAPVTIIDGGGTNMHPTEKSSPPSPISWRNSPCLMKRREFRRVSDHGSPRKVPTNPPLELRHA